MNIEEHILRQGYRMIMTNKKDIQVIENTMNPGTVVLLIHKEEKSYSTELINQLQEAMKAQFELKGLIVESFLTIVIEDESTYFKNRDLEAQCDDLWFIQLDKALLIYGKESIQHFYGLEILIQNYLLQLPKRNRISISEAEVRQDKELKVLENSKQSSRTTQEEIQRKVSRKMVPPVRTTRDYFSREKQKVIDKKVLEVPNRFLRYKRDFSIITFLMLLMNVGIFFYLEYIGDTENVSFMLAHGAANAQIMKSTGSYLPFIESMFLHFGWKHLFNNMLALIFLGNLLEKALGHFKFFVIYIFGGLLGSFFSFQFALAYGKHYVSAGSSGCIFAIIGALFYIVLRNKGKFEDISIYQMGLMVLFSFYSGISNAGVDNMAHFGGFIGGLALAVLFYRKKPRIRRRKR